MEKMKVILLFGILGVCFGDICPDKKSRCPNGSTCCKLSTGFYGCCPYDGATCCSDGLHCCPSHLTCDVSHSRCVTQEEIPYPFAQYVDFNEAELDNALLEVELEVSQQTCPDGIQKCPSSYTCCALVGGGYACCPQNGGVCCSDGIHCCPKNKVCNLAKGECN